MTDYRAYALNIDDLGGDGDVTAEEVARYQQFIDEELARIPDADVSVTVETNATRSRLEIVDFNTDERIDLALGMAFARFTDDRANMARSEDEIAQWEERNA